MKTKWAVIAGLSVILLVIVVATRPEWPGKPYPARTENVIVILIDALRADHLGCYGYPRETTPNLDRFAERAVVFRKAYSPSSWTKPSIPSLFTSLYPSRHGVLEGSSKDTQGFITSDILRDSLVTIAEVLRNEGYSTAGFVQNAQLRGFLGFSQGFDIYNDRAGDAGEINSAFLKWIDGGVEEPFFAYLHYLDVHWPYQPPAPYDTIFGMYASDIDFDTEEWKTLRNDINAGEFRLNDRDIRKMIALYDGELRYLDAQLGRLITEFERRGLLENTLVAITADHGEEFLEHAMIGHGQSLYRELLHIPLIIKFPGGRWGGLEIDTPVGLIDLFPTVTDYLGRPSLTNIDGGSLMPWITGNDTDSIDGHFTYSELYHKGTYQRSLMGAQFELIETYSGNFRMSELKPPSALDNIHPGDRVEVDGKPGENQRFLADQISLDDNQADDDHEVEGTISQIDPGSASFSLMGFRVVAKPDIAVQKSDGTPLTLEDLREGMKVKVNGHAQPESIFEADRVKVKGMGGSRYKLEGLVDGIDSVEGDTVRISIMGLAVLFKAERSAAFSRLTSTVAEDGPPEPVSVELYNFEEDPGERRNLQDSLPEMTRGLLKIMDTSYPSLIHGSNHLKTEMRQLDPATVEELRAIGYVQ